MVPSQAAPRRLARAAERLDRDRQAAPQVFERLRGMIISLALPPGSPLSRAELAGQFGVSSTPIRDALMRLEEEGLVDVFPQYAIKLRVEFIVGGHELLELAAPCELLLARNGLVELADQRFIMHRDAGTFAGGKAFRHRHHQYRHAACA